MLGDLEERHRRAGLDGGAPEDARQMPNPTAASSVTAEATRRAPRTAVCSLSENRLVFAFSPASRSCSVSPRTNAARAAKTVISSTPVTSPAGVRISLKPKSPICNDNRYPPSVDRASRYAPAARRGGYRSRPRPHPGRRRVSPEPGRASPLLGSSGSPSGTGQGGTPRSTPVGPLLSPAVRATANASFPSYSFHVCP